ncbi:MAG: hypothetical protein M0R17_11495 [Candidatus Omnitrophica bacterium]|jgi:hypothetical protein|nr:hypothetical protein [Candidatus Omnitrophota bacterium]
MNTNIDKNELHLYYKKDTGNNRPDIANAMMSNKTKKYIEWLEDKLLEQLKIEAECEKYKVNTCYHW